MRRRDLPSPTDSELAILQVLWEQGASTVRQVHEQLAVSRRTTGYTTTLKLMQIMAEKGLVERDESPRSHLYTAAIDQQKTQRRLIRELLDRAFSGSAATLVMQALAAKKPSPAELKQVRQMLDTYAQQARTPRNRE